MTEASTCVITGSSSGIGLTLTRRLLDEGWTVIGIDRNPPPAETADRIESLTVDLKDPAAIDALPLPTEPGSVTAFVHCAGFVRSDADPASRASGGVEFWLVHVAALEALIRRLMPALKDQRGRIVAMSSRASQGRAGRTFYAASKAGIEAAVRSFGSELLDRGITVNAVAPATTDTPLLQDPARGDLKPLPLPFGRLIQPEEVAALAHFLIGPDAGAITGQTIFICGGASLRRSG